jgi:hypothetical protein
MPCISVISVSIKLIDCNPISDAFNQVMADDASVISKD